MTAYKIKKDIYWVGAVDWNLRNFHGYSTGSGSSYNAYLIIDEKVVLIDTVKAPFSTVLINNITEIIDPSKIDYIISNHVEPDHSGALLKVLEIAKNATVITSLPSGVKGLTMHYGELPLKPVKSGDSLSIGKRTLNFVQTPMVHWPDNMVTYLPEDGILFSNDAFGQHIASSERMDYESDINLVYKEAKKYYANIVMPYGNQVKKALEVLSSLEFDIIAPSHGIIWQKYIPQILEFYKEVTDNTKSEKAVIVYDTMWGNTEKIANAIAEAFTVKGISVKLMNLNHNHISDVITEVMDAKYLAIGSSTINGNILPPVAAFLAYLKGLYPKNLKTVVFGSYGWSGQSTSIIESDLNSLKYIPLCDKISLQFTPSPKQLDEIKKLIISRLDVKDIKLIKEA